MYVAFCQMAFSVMAFLTVAFLQEYQILGIYSDFQGWKEMGYAMSFIFL